MESKMGMPEFRLRVRTDVDGALSQYMSQNQVPPSVMEDALNAFHVRLKDKVMDEFVQSISVPPQEEADNGEDD